MNNNPIEEVRKKQEWSIQELASAAGISFTATYNCLNGTTQGINKKILKVLTKLGYESEEIKVKYQEFRQKKQRELLQEAK